MLLWWLWNVNAMSCWRKSVFHCGDFESNDLLKENCTLFVVVTVKTMIFLNNTTWFYCCVCKCNNLLEESWFVLIVVTVNAMICWSNTLWALLLSIKNVSLISSPFLLNWILINYWSSLFSSLSGLCILAFLYTWIVSYSVLAFLYASIFSYLVTLWFNSYCPQTINKCKYLNIEL